MKLNLKSIFALVLLTIGLVFTQAANAVQFYYSAMLISEGTIITGSTNLVNVNYPPSGGWLTTKGITPNDTEAQGVTFQFVTQQIQTNNAPQYATNLVATIGLALDEASLVGKYPPATNGQFTVTGIVQFNTNNSTYLIQVPSTNFLGAQFFKLLSLNYQGTNQLKLTSLRAGYWY